MTPHYFSSTLDFVLVVLGPLLVALAGTVAAVVWAAVLGREPRRAQPRG